MDGTISIPSAVHCSGVILVVQSKENGALEILAATVNSLTVLGYSPESLFDFRSLTEILDQTSADDIFDGINFIYDDNHQLQTGEPSIFPVSIRGVADDVKSVWCALHPCHNYQDMFIVELKPVSTNINFDSRRGRQKGPLQRSSQFVTRSESEKETSLHTRSRGFTNDEMAMQVSAALNQLQEHLSRSGDLDSLMKTAAWLLKGFIEVQEISIIQFDDRGNRSVAVNLGHHDDEDTKSQCNTWLIENPLSVEERDIYQKKRVNVLKRERQANSNFKIRNHENLPAISNLDMMDSLLQTRPLIDPMINGLPEVSSGVIISIVACENLWGVVRCLNYGDPEIDISFLDCNLCDHFAHVLSHHVERLENKQLP